MSLSYSSRGNTTVTIVVIVVVVAVLLGLIIWNMNTTQQDDTGTDTQVQDTATDSQPVVPDKPAQNINAAYTQSGFVPKLLKISTGDTITMVNKTSESLRIERSDNAPPQAVPAGTLENGESHTYTVQEAGEWTISAKGSADHSQKVMVRTPSE